MMLLYWYIFGTRLKIKINGDRSMRTLMKKNTWQVDADRYQMVHLNIVRDRGKVKEV